MVTALDETALEADARALQRVLTRLIRVYRFRDHQAVCCYDVTPAQCHALEYLAEAGGATLNEVAEALFLEKSSASRMIEILVKKEYVLRERHPEDGRAVLIRLTDTGDELAMILERDILAERRLVLAGFGAEEREVIISAVEKLAEQAVSCCAPAARGESCGC